MLKQRLKGCVSCHNKQQKTVIFHSYAHSSRGFLDKHNAVKENGLTLELLRKLLLVQSTIAVVGCKKASSMHLSVHTPAYWAIKSRCMSQA